MLCGVHYQMRLRQNKLTGMLSFDHEDGNKMNIGNKYFATV
jgi:hypothetical protein